MLKSNHEMLALAQLKKSIHRHELNENLAIDKKPTSFSSCMTNQRNSCGDQKRLENIIIVVVQSFNSSIGAGRPMLLIP